MNPSEVASLANGSSALQNDLRDMLLALGLFDGARPQSPHDVFRECIDVVVALRHASSALLDALDDAHSKGETFTARVSITTARLRDLIERR